LTTSNRQAGGGSPLPFAGSAPTLTPVVRSPLAFLAAFVLVALTVVPPCEASVESELEAGFVFVGRNDVRNPGKGGTAISLSDELKTDPAPVFWVRLGYRFGERHLVTALYAPLQLNATGTVDRDVSFAGGTYPAGTPLLGVYRFDSYRLTYRYSFIRRAGLELAAGVTAKIRDAEVALYGADARVKTNTGFVPLVNVHVAWRPGRGTLRAGATGRLPHAGRGR
jgi:hypothetical protein